MYQERKYERVGEPNPGRVKRQTYVCIQTYITHCRTIYRYSETKCDNARKRKIARARERGGQGDGKSESARDKTCERVSVRKSAREKLRENDIKSKPAKV